MTATTRKPHWYRPQVPIARGAGAVRADPLAELARVRAELVRLYAAHAWVRDYCVAHDGALPPGISDADLGGMAAALDVFERRLEALTAAARELRA